MKISIEFKKAIVNENMDELSHHGVRLLNRLMKTIDGLAITTPTEYEYWALKPKQQIVFKNEESFSLCEISHETCLCDEMIIET